MAGSSLVPDAVTFVSYRVMGKNNKTSYQLTFPDRYTNLVARGATDKDISSFVTAYSKNILVNRIMEQSIVPSWVLNSNRPVGTACRNFR